MTIRYDIKLGPTFGEDITRIRGGNCSLPISGEYSEIFASTVSLDMARSPVEIGSDGVPYIKFSADADSFSVDIANQSLSKVTERYLLRNGRVSTGVDSLSRSIIHQPANEEKLLKQLEERSDVSADTLSTVRETLLTPLIEEKLSSVEASELKDSLLSSIRTHETRHIKDLIDPQTAMLSELELFWQCQLAAASPDVTDDPEILSRIGVLYAIPRTLIAEISSLLTEKYEMQSSQAEDLLSEAFANRRGLGYDLLRTFRDLDLSDEEIGSLVHCDTADQYGDVWLLYVLQQLKQGHSLDYLSSETFLKDTGVDNPRDCIGLNNQPDVRLSEIRDDFVEFMYAHLYGPAFEVVSFDTQRDDGFSLRRQWYNTNPTVSGDENLLAVRRTLYLREFLTALHTNTQLNEFRNTIHQKIRATLDGSYISPSNLLTDIDPQIIASNLYTSLQQASRQLMDTTDRSVTARWLNDVSYDPLLHS